MVSSAFFQIQPPRKSNQPNSPISFFNGNIAQSCSLPKKNMIFLPTIGSDGDTNSEGLGKGALELLESFLSFFSTSLVYFINPPLHPSVDPKHVLTGNFAPVDELPPIDCLVVEGELSQSLNGTYIRNGPNPLHQPRGPHHLFEGDGMLHSIRLSDGRATFCSRYVKTYKYALEDNVGFPIFPNILSGFHSFGLANTSLSLFSNRLFALGESDLPYSIHLSEEGDIETIGRCDFDGKAFVNMTAHPKIDPETGETFAFRCSSIPPYITFFSIDKEGSKQQDVPIFSMTNPTFVHDFSITKQYIVFSESQIEMNPLRLMMCKGMPVSAELDKVPRIGVLPRYASTDSEIRWFEAPGFNAMHAVNAWEEGDEEIILVAPNAISTENLFHNIEKVHFSLEKVRINLRNGSVTRTTLSQKNLELGSINPSYVGKRNRYAYMGIGEMIPKMSGVVKIDMDLECEVSRRPYGAGCFGGEPIFVAKDGASGEDEGYIVSYVHDENSGASRFVVMDANSQTLDVVAAVKLPRRVPYGFHGLFVKDGDIREIY
ncbi:hypothetical protein PVL29_020535 [Vitis rotundifolia]|uniref:Uncharacterized protein n=1 Tax=Vitis rotundifolia TaxID=103349 RepID=A0AA39DBW4_VITRO|nr:hypothetical protein PVL29_020535 [Vitis rotundifolia]